MALGNWIRSAADMADKAGDAVSGATASLKDKAVGLKDKASNAVGDEKDEIVYDGAVEAVQTALINAGLLTKEINDVLQSVEAENPYRD